MKINNSDLLNFESRPSPNPGSGTGRTQNRSFADALRPTGSANEATATRQPPSVQESAGAEGLRPASRARVTRGADLSAAGQRPDAALEATRSLIRSRLGEELQQHVLAQRLVEEVSQMVFRDPALNRNLASLPPQFKDES